MLDIAEGAMSKVWSVYHTKLKDLLFWNLDIGT